MSTQTQPGACCSSRAAPDSAANCPVEATINLIGGKYKSLILWKLVNQTLRFSALRKAVPNATPKMLTQQLRELERDGLVRREVFPVIPPRVEYSLTPFGRSIRPVLESMYAWGTGYLHRQGLEVNCSMTPFDDTAPSLPLLSRHDSVE